MPRILMTGATGFVGHWMAMTCPKGAGIMGVNRAGYYSGLMDEMIGITHIVHLAPILPDKVIELAHKFNARLLFVSSGIVYHPENDTEYRHMKMKGEKMVEKSGLDWVIARLFTFYGEKLDNEKAITTFFDAVRRGEPIKLVGDGSTVRSYMHGSQMGRSLWKVLLEGEPKKYYDIGSRRPITLLRLAKRIQAFTKCRVELVDGIVPMPYYVPSGSWKEIRCPACAELGWVSPRLLLKIRGQHNAVEQIKCHRCKSVIEWSGSNVFIAERGVKNHKKQNSTFE